MIEEYVIDADTARDLSRPRCGRGGGIRHGHFLRGPVPMRWFAKAMALPGMALGVAVMIWFRVGLTGSKSVAINLSRLGFDRTSAARGLASLEAAKLVHVARGRGKKAIVTVLTTVASSERPMRADGCGCVRKVVSEPLCRQLHE
jgi:hypothetical protein